MFEGDLMDKKEIRTLEWYNNPNIITTAIIWILVIMIIISESFAVNNNLSTSDILRNLLNHNSIYLIGLIYFIPLKTKSGKKYFNYLNLFLILIYFIFSITSFLTVIRSFGITSLVNLVLNIVLFIYLLHVLLKNTRIWKELRLELSPFNEISNDNYFYSVIIVSSILLMIDLIGISSFDGVVLSFVRTVYYFLLGRYIYLYQIHLDYIENYKKKVRN